MVDDFLTEYAASIDYVKNNVDAAAELVAQYGITPSAAVAKAAIPQINLVYISGADIRDTINGYFDVLWQANPKSIGGFVPDDSFYYIPLSIRIPRAILPRINYCGYCSPWPSGC